MVDFSHEFEFIRWLREQSALNNQVTVGIGDDAAVVEIEDGQKLLLCTDTLMEGVHFTRETASPRQIGRKAIAVNLSDIVAMGGVPKHALVSICVPKNSSSILEELYRGLWELADEFGVALVGGDTNSWDGPLVVSVTMTGAMVNRAPITRAGAKPGDWILVSGTLGGSLKGKHLHFIPRVLESQQILKVSSINSMIDISDGLIADLFHILEESQVGAELQAERIPISEAAVNCDDDRSDLEHALHDGEDFELLFTMDSLLAEKLLTAWNGEVPITHIGQIVEGEGARLNYADGTSEKVATQGWKHEF